MRSSGARRLAVLPMLALAASILTGTGAAASGCADPEHPGGAWPSYGGDLRNSRSQPNETGISSVNAVNLQAAWTFSPQDEGGTGPMQSTPVVAEGCVYIATAAGYLYALNADTGALVWKDRLAETVQGVCCGGTLFAPAVADGVVYANVSSNPGTSPDGRGSHVVALDAHSGEILWRSGDVADEPGAYTNASAVHHDGIIIFGISNPESGFHRIGGFALVDAETGELLKRTRTVPSDQADEGYAGGSIWSTAAVDAATGYAFASTGQPSPWDGKESELVNAIIKFDVARARDERGNPVASEEITNPRFGEIVGARKGTPDEAPYVDVDFAGSPTLYDDANGQQMVAAFQKSGWLHAARTRHMTAAWSTPLSPVGTFYGNYASTATDGSNIFGIGDFPGQIWSIDGTTGRPNWVSPVATTVGANPVAYANGVVYHNDGKGFLDLYDAQTGVPVTHRPMSLDTGATCTNIGGGLAIARNTVYAVCGDRGLAGGFSDNEAASGWLIAYRLAP